jgi:hypothetical protein
MDWVCSFIMKRSDPAGAVAEYGPIVLTAGSGTF